jgi:hypothetical protein
VHIPRNLEGGEVSLTDSPSGRLEFKAESYSVNWLGWVAVGVLFGCGTVRPSVTEWVVQSCDRSHAEKRKMKSIKGKYYKDG